MTIALPSLRAMAFDVARAISVCPPLTFCGPRCSVPPVYTIAVVFPALSASLTSGQVIMSNSTSGSFFAVAACFAAAGFAAVFAAGAWANAVAADSARTGINIKRRMIGLLLLLQVFELGLRLRVGRVELEDLLDGGDRAGLVPFGGLHLRDGGIRAHRLRPVLDVRLQIRERIVRLPRGVGALRHGEHGRLAEVVALTRVELLAQRLEPRDTRRRPSAGGRLGHDLGAARR